MNSNKNNNQCNPKDIKFSKEITNNSFSDWIFENSFIIFRSFNGFYLLIYATKTKSIVSYDLINFKIINEIKNCHKEYITNFRHCFNNNTKRDLVMSVSRNDNNIKIWESFTFQCLLNLEKINNDGLLNSATFLLINNNYYIVTSNRNWTNPEPIKIFDLKGKKIEEIKNSKNNTFFIDVYYDKTNSKQFIVSGNEGSIISYDYSGNNIYNRYVESNENNIFHHSLIIYEDEYIIKLIESSDGNGNIRIWDFHTADLLKKINASNKSLRGINLWNNKYLFVGCGDKTIKLIELDGGKIINNLIGHTNNVCSFKIILHPKYGKCIISQGHEDDQIKIWTNQN